MCARRPLAVALAVLAGMALGAVLGCASPGQPRPPSLHIPRLAADLHAERVGNVVHLTWTTPADSTDGQGLRGPVIAQICREPQPKAARPASCVPAGTVVVSPGPSAADDPLPPALRQGTPAPLRYRVELRTAAGRSAGWSDPAYAAAGAAPPPVGNFSASLARGAVLLRWTAAPGDAAMELTRTLLSPPATPGGGSPAAAPPAASTALLPESAGRTVLLGTGPMPTADPGGLRDAGVRAGAVYRYTARRVLSVQLSGPEGPLTLVLRGAVSTPAEVRYREAFAPDAPVGLATFALPGDPDAMPPAAPALDLSWEAPAMPVAGYNVYRADGVTGDATFRKLNSTALPGPAYHDASPSARGARYRVTAVDRAGNESAPSATVTVPAVR